ncbi:hypothetical protein E3N88_42579 [Mikania micrantha]|uniref:ADP/ATP translocase n=1 Tax=Mikania micrantha TaxID=192012 RepID=A0A5N6LHB9_9ASTR|nr:hypothetical protein E3N88_42579 [Mikania micrantha]
MASEEVVGKTSATIANLAEEARIASVGVKAPSRHALLSICKSLIAGGVAEESGRSGKKETWTCDYDGLAQVQNPHAIKYNGTIQGLKHIWRTEGFRGLFKRNGTYCARIIPNSAVKFFSYEEASNLNFAVYESLKDWLVKSRPFGLAEDAELGFTTKLACGAAAGTVGQTVAYPLDVIRRRMQMVGWKHAASVVTADGKSALEYTGMVDAFRSSITGLV